MSKKILLVMFLIQTPAAIARSHVMLDLIRARALEHSILAKAGSIHALALRPAEMDLRFHGEDRAPFSITDDAALQGNPKK